MRVQLMDPRYVKEMKCSQIRSALISTTLSYSVVLLSGGAVFHLQHFHHMYHVLCYDVML